MMAEEESLDRGEARQRNRASNASTSSLG